MEVENIYSAMRRFERRPLQVRVAVLIGHSFYFETAFEVGEGGMLLRIERPLAKDLRLEVAFLLPDGSFVTAVGEVIYHFSPEEGGNYAGIRFVNLPEDAGAAIRGFISKKAKV